MCPTDQSHCQAVILFFTFSICITSFFLVFCCHFIRFRLVCIIMDPCTNTCWKGKLLSSFSHLMLLSDQNMIDQLQKWPWSNINYDIPGTTPTQGSCHAVLQTLPSSTSTVTKVLCWTKWVTFKPKFDCLTTLKWKSFSNWPLLRTGWKAHFQTVFHGMDSHWIAHLFTGKVTENEGAVC